MKQLFAIAITFLLPILLPIPGAFAQQVDDQAIVERVVRAIENNEETEGAEILVVSVNGYVLLAGQALSAEQKQEASIAAAFASNSMRRLINELEVVDEIDFSADLSDRALLDSIMEIVPQMSPSTNVTIHNGTVHLLGRVTREEGNEVATAISKIDGVANVRMSYEFIQ